MASPLKQTKEYQLLLRPDKFAGGADPRTVLFGMLAPLAGRPELEFGFDAASGERWSRTSDRYDTPDRWLESQALASAVEFSVVEGKGRSKVKLKANQWDPDLLCDPEDPRRLVVAPADDYRKIADLKFEEDFNAVGIKFALGCSIIRKGTEPVRFQRLGELGGYFRRLDKLPGYAADTPLERLDTGYREEVLDEIGMEVAGLALEGSLGRRFKAGADGPFKVEFSFRVERPQGGWGEVPLMAAYRLFLAMAESDLHLPWDEIARPRPPGFVA